MVGNDNSVRYRSLCLQIPPSPLRPHFVKLRVRVHDYPDGTLAIFHGPRCLARYRADGSLLNHDQPLAASGRWTARPCGSADKPAACPQPHRPHHNSGQPMCYQHRST